MSGVVVVERPSHSVVTRDNPRRVVRQSSRREVVVRESSHFAVLERRITSVVARGAQGPAGATGAVVRYQTEGALSALRAVRQQADGYVVYQSSADVDQMDCTVGITVQATAGAGGLEVRRSGRMEDAGWNWIPGKPVFLGLAGALTQTPPMSGFLLRVGFAPTATSLDVQIGTPVIRG